MKADSRPNEDRHRVTSLRGLPAASPPHPAGVPPGRGGSPGPLPLYEPPREVVVSTEANKALVRRFYEEIDKGNLAAMDELVAEDYIDHSPPPFPGLSPGRAGLKQAFEIFWVATPGQHHIEEQIAEGDKVVTRIRVTGTHEDDLPGISKTGNVLETTATVTHRIEDGRLAEKWSNKDELGFLQQLGVIPTPEAHAS